MKLVRSADVMDDLPVDTEQKPIFLVGFGRGRVGKSTFCRLVLDRAHHAGRQTVLAADGDRSQTLASYYPSALKPDSAEDEDVGKFLTNILDKIALERVSVVLDLGGGDKSLATYGRQLELVEFCLENGIRPVVVYCVGPHSDDLKHVALMEESGVFQPEATIVVLNEGLISVGRTAHGAF